MTQREQLVVWLTDAYAMEMGIVTMLQKHAEDAKEFPKVHAATMKHLSETENHAAIIQSCLESLEAHPSKLKTGFAKVTSYFGDMPTSLAHDSVIKNGITEYATEHQEIASYTALIDAATALGFPAIAASCRKILAEEKAQAKRLALQLKRVSKQHLASLQVDRPILDVLGGLKKKQTKSGACRIQQPS